MIRNDRRSAERICVAYGLNPRLGASIVPVSRGAVGRIWRLDVGAQRFAVKELFTEADETAVRREVAFTSHVEAAGIRLPRSLADANGSFVTKLTDADRGWLRLYHWVEGNPVDLADPSTADRIGHLIGRLHAQAIPPQEDPDPWYCTVPDVRIWDPAADSAQSAGMPWALALRERLGILRELTELAVSADQESLITCHRDLHPDNALMDSSGYLVLLDWDDAGPAHPGHELVRLLADWHVNKGRADLSAMRRTVAAYRDAGGPALAGDRQSWIMLIACRLNFLHGQISVALDPDAEAADRQYASAEISESLALLPTPSLFELISRILTA